MNIQSLKQNLKKKLVSSIFFRSLYAKVFSYGNLIEIKGRQNIIETSGSILRKNSIIIEGDNNNISLGIGCYLEGVKIVIKAESSKLILGKSVFVGQGSILWIEGKESRLEIGEHSSLEKVGIASSDGQAVHIGRDCLLSYDVDIRCTDSHSILDQDTNNIINPPKSVKICDHVWLGARSIILKGVTIGEGFVVGAGSVIAKSVEPNAIAAGNPAKIIKQNIYWKR